MSTGTRQEPQRAPRSRSAGSTVAGLLGEILITAGILLGLFVVWQVWWTDVIANRSADLHIEQWQAQAPEPANTDGEPRTDEPPTEDPVGPGEQLGVMYVPAWGDDWRFPIAGGTDYAAVLDNGFIGHFEQTALPGEVGNLATAGHRQSYGRPYYHVDSLEAGEPIIVRTLKAWYVYRVTGNEVIAPTDVDVLEPVPREPGVEATDRQLTMITCHPLWSVAQRYVVYAEFDYWVDLQDGYPPDLPDAARDA